jgi:hypothetical protein
MACEAWAVVAQGQVATERFQATSEAWRAEARKLTKDGTKRQKKLST